MTVARTTLLDLPIITTGTESGLWGDYTNNGLTQYLDIAIAGITSLTSANFTTGALTIETTEGTNSATNIVATSAQYATIRVSSLAQASTITVGNTGTNPGRSYRLINDDSTYALTFKATGQTGITLQPGQSAVVAFNGTDYALVGTIGPTVPVARGGTGLTSGTSGGVLAFTATGTLASSTALASNAIVIGGGAGAAPSTTTTGTGVVTAVGNAVNTSGGLVTQTGTLASSAILLGGGSATAISSTTTGTGVVTAVGNAVNTSGGLVTQSGTLTANNVLLGGGASTAISSSSLLATSAAVTSGTYIKSIGYADTVVALGNTGTAINLDVVSGGVFTATLTGNATITLRYPVSSGASSFTLILTNDATAGRTVAWAGGSFKFPGGAASLSRTTTANAIDIWVFFTPDGGTTYYGNIAMKNMTA
jgi:hypothetical protein